MKLNDVNLLDAAERAALRCMLDALEVQGVGQAVTTEAIVSHMSRRNSVLDDVKWTPLVDTAQAAAMDETGTYVLGRGELGNAPPAPTPAAADPSSTAPVDPSVFSAPPSPASALPAASAPVPPAPPAPALPPSPAGGGELDTNGLPWDERIHSTSKAKNQDGSWRARRNMSDEQKAAVPGIEAELRARGAGQSAAPLPPVPRAPVNPLLSAELVATAAANSVTLPAAPAPAPVPLPPATPTSTPPAAVPAAAVGTWVELIQLYTENVGVLDQAEVDQMARDAGPYEGIMFMGKAPVEHIQAVAAAIGEKLNG